MWLCGVRRSGKTTLAESLGAHRMLHVNCDLPTVEDMVRDPQVLFRRCSKPVVVFDEIHQLRDPARVLKIGADGFPQLLPQRPQLSGDTVRDTGAREAVWQTGNEGLHTHGHLRMTLGYPCSDHCKSL